MPTKPTTDQRNIANMLGIDPDVLAERIAMNANSSVDSPFVSLSTEQLRRQSLSLQQSGGTDEILQSIVLVAQGLLRDKSNFPEGTGKLRELVGKLGGGPVFPVHHTGR